MKRERVQKIIRYGWAPKNEMFSNQLWRRRRRRSLSIERQRHLAHTSGRACVSIVFHATL